jgi:hypothetical protein
MNPPKKASPQKSECPVVAGQVADQSTGNALIFSPQTPSAQEPNFMIEVIDSILERSRARRRQDAEEAEQVEARLKARIEKAGHSVHNLGSGGYVVCKWNLARHCPDLRALAAFAKQIGVAL